MSPQLSSLTMTGSLQLVGRPEDPGNVEITGGQSFILHAQEAATIEISGEGWYNTPPNSHHAICREDKSAFSESHVSK